MDRWWWIVIAVSVALLVLLLLRRLGATSSGPQAADRGLGDHHAPGAPETAANASEPAAALLSEPAADPDDLEVIEGIGPKLHDVLREAGISTFAQLADAAVDELQAIVDSAGSRFKLATPETWPDQARLAAAGDWDGLTALQESLTAGRR